jgi:serine phosphatase RsbU (regulator of sigma subunit)
METATEVGGDYYDFSTEEDGTLTLAVGDATGHGMKAGTMVTATKSLFNALGQEQSLLGIFDRSTRALKGMNMRQLYMALTLAKFKDGRLRFATAGMPPTLVYRAATGLVETIRLKGMPLGSFVDFPCKEEEITLAPGDTVLFMSDGFPELFNQQGEMLGYDRAVEIFTKVAQQ